MVAAGRSCSGGASAGSGRVGAVRTGTHQVCELEPAPTERILAHRVVGSAEPALGRAAVGTGIRLARLPCERG